MANPDIGIFVLPANCRPATGLIQHMLMAELPSSQETIVLDGDHICVTGHEDGAIAAILTADRLEAMRLARNAELKGHFEELVRDEAERCRARFVTKRPGKQNAYQVKVPIAQRIVNNGANAHDITLLQGEADSRNMPIRDLAELIVDKNNEFNMISSQIEAIEAESVAHIRAVPTDIDDMQNALEDLVLQMKDTTLATFPT